MNSTNVNVLHMEDELTPDTPVVGRQENHPTEDEHTYLLNDLQVEEDDDESIE